MLRMSLHQVSSQREATVLETFAQSLWIVVKSSLSHVICKQCLAVYTKRFDAALQVLASHNSFAQGLLLFLSFLTSAQNIHLYYCRVRSKVWLVYQ